jgi:predicted nuclease of predicted toxin-antitoxin system
VNTPPVMRLFVDHCVPESVPKMLEEAGYAVIRLREKTAPDSPDSLVAAVAEANDAVLGCVDTYRIHRMMAARVTTAR